MKIGIFSTPENFHQQIGVACQELGVEYVFIDIMRTDWMDHFNSSNCTSYILRPPTHSDLMRNLFKLRIISIKDKIDGKCIPTVEDILYYESKILMLDHYKLHNIPHVDSYTYFSAFDAFKSVDKSHLPLIAKTDGGSGGLGVYSIESMAEFRIAVIRSFFTLNLIRGTSFRDFIDGMKRYLRPIYQLYRTRSDYFYYSDYPRGYIHLQKKIKVKREWRIVVIGDSFFGHAKSIGKRGLHSGSNIVDWTPPSSDLLNFVSNIYKRLKSNSMAFDVFENEEGEFYVNEMQSVFGAYAPSQMYINGVPGRFRMIKGEWLFETGEFCVNGCYNLRIEFLERLYKSSQTQENI